MIRKIDLLLSISELENQVMVLEDRIEKLEKVKKPRKKKNE